MAAAVTSKLEAGNFRAAIRIICSSDTLAQLTRRQCRHCSRNILLQPLIVDHHVNRQEISALSLYRSPRRMF